MVDLPSKVCLLKKRFLEKKWDKFWGVKGTENWCKCDTFIGIQSSTLSGMGVDWSWKE
jgi:hypothetical protein